MKRLITFILSVSLLVACSAPSQPSESQPPMANTAAPQVVAPQPAMALASFWKDEASGHWLKAIDPLTGEDSPEHAPLNLGKNYWYTFAPDGRTLTFVHYPYSDFYSRSTVRVLDLQTWQTVTTTIQVDGWADSLTYSADGRYLALGYTGLNSHLMVIDMPELQMIAQLDIPYAARQMRFTPDGKQLMVYGADNHLHEKHISTPNVILFNAADLTTLWEQTLPAVQDGFYPGEDPQRPELRLMWEPAVVFAREANRLYVVHAQEDRLTTIDFDQRALQTHAIRPSQTWLDRWIESTAQTAYAKEMGGTQKSAVLSPDGQTLYVVGNSYQPKPDAKGRLQVTATSLGLQVVEVATGREVATLATEATEVYLAPDQLALYLVHWRNVNFDQQGTEIFDLASQTITRQIKDYILKPAPSLAGPGALLAGHYPDCNCASLVILDAQTGEVAHAQKYNLYAEWLMAK